MTRRAKGGPGSEPFNAPFSGLAGRLGVSASPPAPAEPRPPARAVVRLERKGRGGREVTVVEKLALSEEDRTRWLKELKEALGCGGAVEGEALVLQGDLRQRVRALLAQRGVRQVTLG